MPSPWVTRYAAAFGPGTTALDLACGAGRHSRWLAARGLHVTAVDRDLAGIKDIINTPNIEAIACDLEDGTPWPLNGQVFDVVVVTNYLYRPLLPTILNAVASAGLLIYETFALGNERFGRPKNPNFLLQQGELATLMDARFEVLGFEDLTVTAPRPAVIQHIAARRR